MASNGKHMKKLSSLSELRAQMDPEVVREADAEFAEEYVSYTLGQLRRNRGLSQAAVAEILNKTQATISKLENTRGSAVMLSSIEEFVGAIGGKIELRVVFPDGHSYPLASS